MLALQFNLGISWSQILGLLVSIVVWGTVIVGFVLIVREHIEEDSLHVQHFLQPLPGPKAEENQLAASSCSLDSGPDIRCPAQHAGLETISFR